MSDIARQDEFYQILSPHQDGQGVWIHQDAWFHIGEFTAGTKSAYSLNKEGNGIYIFILDGQVDINRIKMNERDGLGITEVNSFDFSSIHRFKSPLNGSSNAELVVITRCHRKYLLLGKKNP